MTKRCVWFWSWLLFTYHVSEFSRKQSLSSGRFFDVLGTTDDDQPENVDATLERDFGGDTGDVDSDDERHGEGS